MDSVDQRATAQIMIVQREKEENQRGGSRNRRTVCEGDAMYVTSIKVYW